MKMRDCFYKLLGTQEFEDFLDFMKEESEKLDKISTPIPLDKDFEGITTESKILAQYIGKSAAKSYIDALLYKINNYEKFFKEGE